MSRHIGKTQRVMKEQARSFFASAPREDTDDKPLGRSARRRQEEGITYEDREAAMKKLRSYEAPLKEERGEKKIANKMKKALGIREPREDVPNYKVVKRLRKTNLGVLVAELAEINERISDYEKDKAGTRGEIQLLVELAGIKSVIVDGWMVTRTEGRKANEKIDRKKIARQLQKRGFSPDDVAVIINSSIVKGKPGKPTIVVTDMSKPRGSRVKS